VSQSQYTERPTKPQEAATATAPFRVLVSEWGGEHCFEVHPNSGDGPTFCLTNRADGLLVDGGQGVDGRSFLRVHEGTKDGSAVELRADGVEVHRGR
jgi:hypothetical protein